MNKVTHMKHYFILLSLIVVFSVAAQGDLPDPVDSNSDWTPIEREFDNVVMVLVPPGCLMMGSEDGGPDERPVHEICFDEPFWMDQYEVTQAQLRGLGGEKANDGDVAPSNQPVIRITWFEARDFCALRGACLPTEAEWEYAARGPDGWVFPWGDEWNEANAVWGRPWDSLDPTADVGSIPAGASWVGALDMTGNVLEWTSSVYRAYPYAANDGREGNAVNRPGVQRVLRGGSWKNSFTSYLRAATRVHPRPDLAANDIGFRCARDYDG